MYQGYKLGIVVPAYNEEKLIAQTLESMPRRVDRIYVVDDGSTDATRQIIGGFSGERFCILSNGRNRGVGAAIATGYKKALEENIDIVVVMAGDNQMHAEYLPELLDPIIKGKADYAKGNRLSKLEHRRGMSNWRFFGNWVLTLLTKIATGYWKIRDSQNGYTAITRDALKRINLDKVYPRYGYCNDLLVKLNVAGCKVADVSIPARYGREKSKIKYGKYITAVSPLLLQGFLLRLRMKYLRSAAMNLDFTLNKYKQLCDAVRCCGYTSSTVADYLENHDSGQKAIVLRHDVDRKPQRALQMAKLEHEFGIKSTYYFRFNRKVFQPHLIREIANMGHEIGYHYETLDKTNGDYEKAIQMFEHELDEFREIAEVKTVCMHGNPLTKHNNRDLWTKYDFRNFGLIGEAYLSLNDVTYLSDTGRTWGAKHKVKDYLPSASNNSQGVRKAIVTSTDDIIELIRKGQLGRAYLLVHPERWSNSLISWTRDLALDTGVNLAKRILLLREREELVKGMESKKTGYDNFYAEKDFTHFKQDSVYISQLCSFLPPSNYKNSLVLDVGCGTGCWSGLFRECGVREVVGIDISSAGLHRACRENPRAIFILADAQRLPFKERSFDLVFCQGLSLYSVDELSSTESLGRELLRCCKDNGLFVFAWSTNLSGGRRKSGLKEHRRENLVAYLNSLGCEVIETYFIDRMIFLRILGRHVFNSFFAKFLIPTICRVTGLPGHLVCITKKMPISNAK